MGTLRRLLPLLGLAAAKVQSVEESLLMVAAVAQQDSGCSDGPVVSESTCLGKKDKCMFLELDERNLCLPCEWAGQALPCAPEGAIYPQGKVKTCKMACAHKEVITKMSVCTDVSGTVTKEKCYSKGTQDAQCMFTSFKNKVGDIKSMCGPCKVDGFGEVPVYVEGSAGPEPDTIVLVSQSQCIDATKPTTATTTTTSTSYAPKLGDKPVVVPLAKTGITASKEGPAYVGVPVSPPYSPKDVAEAAEVAAKAAGFKPGQKPTPFILAPETGSLPAGTKATELPPGVTPTSQKVFLSIKEHRQ